MDMYGTSDCESSKSTDAEGEDAESVSDADTEEWVDALAKELMQVEKGNLAEEDEMEHQWADEDWKETEELEEEQHSMSK
eukprot:1358268-Karenia_brevis.AAC.1